MSTPQMPIRRLQSSRATQSTPVSPEKIPVKLHHEPVNSKRMLFTRQLEFGGLNIQTVSSLNEKLPLPATIKCYPVPKLSVNRTPSPQPQPVPDLALIKEIRNKLLNNDQALDLFLTSKLQNRIIPESVIITDWCVTGFMNDAKIALTKNVELSQLQIPRTTIEWGINLFAIGESRLIFPSCIRYTDAEKFEPHFFGQHPIIPEPGYHPVAAFPNVQPDLSPAARQYRKSVKCPFNTYCVVSRRVDSDPQNILSPGNYHIQQVSFASAAILTRLTHVTVPTDFDTSLLQMV